MPSFSWRRTSAGIGVILVLTMALAACQNSAAEDPATTTAPAGDQTAAPTPTTAAPPATGESAPPAAADTTVANPKLNLNEATAEELQATIPDFGNRMVREFFEYRPYVSIQQFRREMGKYVSDEQIALYEQYVYVPVAFNDADAETLKQIPGVDDVAAAALMAARPYADGAAFLTKVAEVAPSADVALARTYLGSE